MSKVKNLKKKINKVAKQPSKKKNSKLKKSSLKVKRLDSEVQHPKDIVVVQPPADSPSPSSEKKVVTKLVVKDGVVIVEPISNPFDD